MEIDHCWSEYHEIWIGALYIYNFLLMAACLYCAWLTRHVSLPSLNDASHVCTIVCYSGSMGLALLPVLMIQDISMMIKFAATASSILLTAAGILSFLFLPKVIRLLHHLTNSYLEVLYKWLI